MIITKNSLLSLEKPSRATRKNIDFDTWASYTTGQLKLAHFKGDTAIQIPAPVYPDVAEAAIEYLKDAGYNAELVEENTQIYINFG